MVIEFKKDENLFLLNVKETLAFENKEDMLKVFSELTEIKDKHGNYFQLKEKKRFN